MPISSTLLSSPSWKDYFLKSKNLSYSNLLLEKIRKSVDPSRPFSSSVLEISKNPGIAFISLDASEEKLQLFHHVAVIGGSWTMEKEMLVGVLGSSSNLVPIQIMSNSIKEIKGKSFTFDQIADRLKSKNSLNHDRTAKSDFNNYNILPIPALLTQVFLELEDTDPFSVATAFFQAMYQFDSEEISDNNLEFSQTNDHQSDEENSKSSLDVESPGENQDSEISNYTENKKNLFAEEFVHILQFCQLCHSKKVPPVFYTLIEASSVKEWFSSVKTSLGFNIPKTLKRVNPNTPSASLDQDQIPKISRVDDHLISTMLKIHESFDNNLVKSIKDKEEKEPGFKRLELHKQNLILNASAVPPFDQKATEPSEFYKTFSQKKTQFKAKEFLIHRLHIDNIAFHPSSTFTTCLWNG
jgi:hypothetical protein